MKITNRGFENVAQHGLIHKDNDDEDDKEIVAKEKEEQGIIKDREMNECRTIWCILLCCQIHELIINVEISSELLTLLELGMLKEVCFQQSTVDFPTDFMS
jgi:hypothetical protein